MRPFCKSAAMVEANQLLAHRFDFRQTRVYQRHKSRLDPDNGLRRYNLALGTVQQLDDYFERYVALFRSVQVHGLLPHDQAAHLGTPLARPSLIRDWRSARYERDIGVAVGPKGELLALPGGKHRLAIAHALGLPTVPVEVRLLHTGWLAGLNADAPQDWLAAIGQGLQGLAAQPLSPTDTDQASGSSARP